MHASLLEFEKPLYTNTHMKTIQHRYFRLVLALLIFPFALNAQNVLVISGGGARGAWGGGVAEALHEHKGRNYTKVIGTSTGSLLMPLILLNEFEELKRIYTSVRQKDIFNVNPFKTKGKKKGSLKVGKAVWRIIWGKKTLGKSRRLRRLIKGCFSKDRFEKMRREGKEGISTVVNVTTNKTHYKSTNSHVYKDMIDWIWVSCNQPIFMSLYHTGRKKRDREYWVDGGIKEFVAIDKAIELAAKNGDTEVDVIINNFSGSLDTAWRSPGILKLLFRTLDIYSTDVRENDVRVGELLAALTQAEDEFLKESGGDAAAAARRGLKLNIYFMPERLVRFMPNSLLFEKDKMLQLWTEGRNIFAPGSPYKCKEFKVSKDTKIRSGAN